MTAEARREQMLDVTKALVAEPASTPCRSRRWRASAGITRPVVYRHFGDLAALLDALVEREDARALTQLASVLPDDLGGRPARAADRGVRAAT